MLRVLGKLPRELVVAVSGGPDSMAILDFLSNNHKVTAFYFDHRTEFGEEAYSFVKQYCKEKEIPLAMGSLSQERPSKTSIEEHWRNERYKEFHGFNLPVVTGHNLDDVVEWFLFTSIHGQGRLIPYKNKNVIRPFLSTPKENFVRWCENKNVPFLTDPGNHDRKYMRSIVRHDILPNAKEVNPGIHKTFRKLVEQRHAEMY